MRIDLNLSKDIVKKALSKGASAVEVYMFASEGLSVDVKDQQVEALEVASDWGYSIRVLKGQRQGFAYSNSKDHWEDVLSSALEAADLAQEDEFYRFSEPAQIPQVEVYDRKIPDVSPEEAIAWARSIEEQTRKRDNRIVRTRKSSVSLSETEVLLMNSLGFEHAYRATSVDVQIVVAAEQNGEAQMGWGWMGGRSLGKVDFEAVATDAARRATQLLGARKTPTTKGYIILESATVAELLGVLSGAFSSDSVQKGKSLFAGKLGQKVGSEAVMLIDTGLLPWRSGSRPFDAEGVPSQRTVLVERGVLQGYLYNLYTASREARSSTSNAVRAGIYSPPSVGISNLIIQPSSEQYRRALEDLIGAVDRGMLVTEVMGVHTANPVTGEFSIGASGLWIENGQIAYPVREAAISGTFQELLQKVVCFSTNTRFYGRIGCSDLLIEDINISG